MSVFPHYLFGLRIDYPALECKNKELSDLAVSEFKKYNTSVPPEHGVAGNKYTHSMPNYERILKEGLLSYEERIKKIKDEEIRDGLLLVMEGIKLYIHRSVQYLESVDADINLVNALKKVHLNPAENIYEAVVSWNFIMYLDNCDNLGCVASGLAPYHRERT